MLYDNIQPKINKWNSDAVLSINPPVSSAMIGVAQMHQVALFKHVQCFNITAFYDLVPHGLVPHGLVPHGLVPQSPSLV
jgi:hypothetical protein